MPSAKTFQLVAEEKLELIAHRFRALSETSRLKIVIALFDGEKNVTEILKATGLTQANVSKHLQLLYQAKVVSRRRHKIHIFYRINESAAHEIVEALRKLVNCGS